jgi:succinylglutamic semialdehyde dehydrogenase
MSNSNNFRNISSGDSTAATSKATGELADTVAIEQVFADSVQAWAGWKATSMDQRIAIVERYAEILEDQKSEIACLITEETSKLPSESAAEVSASIAKVRWSIQALTQRRSETELNSDSGVVRRIRYAPLGVVLVLGPFNFPLHLPGGQIIPALLAGNTVVFKPSEQASKVGRWMSDAWTNAGLPAGVLQMITGGPEVAIAAIDQPDVAAVFLTGGRSAGQAIHRQLAGRPEVLLALELGGNNPIVIAPDADADCAASQVSYSAFVSSGQRCTCARRAIYLKGPDGDQQLSTLIAKTKTLTLGMPRDTPQPKLGPLVSSVAADRLRDTYEQLLRMGGVPLLPFWVSSDHPSLVGPAIVDVSNLNSSQLETLGQMEWFGPLLVIQRAPDLAGACDLAAQTPYGLAASLLGGTQDDFQQFVDSVDAGVINWNGPTTGAAGNLPFGGRGWSGNHRPAGFFAVDFCNEPIASIENPRVSKSDPWKPAT